MLPSLANPDDRAALERRIRLLSPDRKGLWGKMTPAQAVCHLSDTYRVGLGEIHMPRVRLPLPLGLIRWLMLYSRVPWPKGVPTRPELRQGNAADSQGTKPGDFTQDCQTLLQLQDRYCTCADRPAHPLFGKMSDADWLRMGYLHVDHHLRQFGV